MLAISGWPACVGDGVTRKIALTLYADERKKLCGRWDYMALLFVPTDALSSLRDKLAVSRSRHSLDTPLKFADLPRRGRGARVRVATEWAQLVISEAQGNGDLYFAMLGIDRHNLDYSAFGEGESSSGKYATVYNRFFRSVLIGGLKRFFSGYSEIIVDEVIHDSEGNLQTHEYFDWHPIMYADRSVDKVTFRNDRIRFVSSRSGKPNSDPLHTELIQFADIVIGSVSHCVECHNEQNRGQHEVARPLLPLVERMSRNPANPNSRYNYSRRYSLAFFPKARGTIGADGPGPDALYSNRAMALKEKLSGQGRLWRNG